MKIFLKFFFSVLILDFVIGLIVNLVYQATSNMNIILSFLNFMISVPLSFVSRDYPYYANGSTLFIIMLVLLNTFYKQLLFILFGNSL